MKIKSSGIIDGVILDKYGKRGNMELSIPLEFIDYPKETVSFAVIIEDFDAIDGGSGTMTTRCYVNIYNTCIGEGMIYKDSSDGSYYMYRNNLVFIKSPVVG